MNNQWFSKVAVWMVIAMVLFTVFKQFDGRTTAGAGYMGYSEFLNEVKGQARCEAPLQATLSGQPCIRTAVRGADAFHSRYPTRSRGVSTNLMPSPRLEA